MSAHNNFSCRLDAAVLEAIRFRWRSSEGDRTMSEIVNELLEEALGGSEIESAEARLDRKNRSRDVHHRKDLHV